MEEPLIHPTAIVSKGAEIATNVKIGAYSIIESGAILRDNVIVHPHVHISKTVEIGARSEVFSFAALGHPPQDKSFTGEMSRLFIGCDTVIREYVTMHCGTKNGRSETRIGDRGYFMAGSHIAHDCIVGDDVVFAQSAAIGGHAVIGNGCNIGAMSGVHQFCSVGNYAFIGSMSLVTKDVIPYAMALGNHATLAGLNTVGLKRRKVSSATIKNMRSAYRKLFQKEGVFEQRVKDVQKEFNDTSEVIEIINFITGTRKRSLCLPDVK
ncbi:acyl-ACP--UDP-N-acetylglucosamine O-acyltransferase [Oceanicaulis sp. AH-315-P02]|nr:acyl-ACP--UDP-N-acetylglucosamine O-acyltransferase [Robiginitomaculum sp.]MBN4047749.1 acyl-ACP--UDP-N-acetylglucosamine O-acyltransferase [Oceanicaulis sp. AH-315-P02]